MEKQSLTDQMLDELEKGNPLSLLVLDGIAEESSRSFNYEMYLTCLELRKKPLGTVPPLVIDVATHLLKNAPQHYHDQHQYSQFNN